MLHIKSDHDRSKAKRVYIINRHSTAQITQLPRDPLSTKGAGHETCWRLYYRHDNLIYYVHRCSETGLVNNYYASRLLINCNCKGLVSLIHYFRTCLCVDYLLTVRTSVNVLGFARMYCYLCVTFILSLVNVLVARSVVLTIL